MDAVKIANTVVVKNILYEQRGRKGEMWRDPQVIE